MDGLIVEEYFCQVIHVVVKFWLDEIVGEHRIEHLALNLYAVVHQHLVIVFDVLSHFQDFRVLVERFEDVYDF